MSYWNERDRAFTTVTSFFFPVLPRILHHFFVTKILSIQTSTLVTLLVSFLVDITIIHYMLCTYYNFSKSFSRLSRGIKPFVAQKSMQLLQLYTSSHLCSLACLYACNSTHRNASCNHNIWYPVSSQNSLPSSPNNVATSYIAITILSVANFITFWDCTWFYSP